MRVKGSFVALLGCCNTTKKHLKGVQTTDERVQLFRAWNFSFFGLGCELQPSEFVGSIEKLVFGGLEAFPYYAFLFNILLKNMLWRSSDRQKLGGSVKFGFRPK